MLFGALNYTLLQGTRAEYVSVSVCGLCGLSLYLEWPYHFQLDFLWGSVRLHLQLRSHLHLPPSPLALLSTSYLAGESARSSMSLVSGWLGLGVGFAQVLGAWVSLYLAGESARSSIETTGKSVPPG